MKSISEQLDDCLSLASKAEESGDLKLAISEMERMPQEFRDVVWSRKTGGYLRDLNRRTTAHHVGQLIRYLLSMERVDEAKKIIDLLPPQLRRDPEVMNVFALVQRKRKPVFDRLKTYLVSTDDHVRDIVFSHLLHIIERLEEIKPDLIIDIGCGIGRLVIEAKRRLPDCSVFGFDICPEHLRVAKIRADEQGVEVSLRQLDLLSPDVLSILADSLDLKCERPVVIASELIEHMEDPRVLTRCLSALYSYPGNARLFLTTPDVESYFMFNPEAEQFKTCWGGMQHLHCFSCHELVSLFEWVPEQWKISQRPVTAFLEDEGTESCHLIEISPLLPRGEHLRDRVVDLFGKPSDADLPLLRQLAIEGDRVRIWADPLERERFIKGVAWYHQGCFDPYEPRDVLVGDLDHPAVKYASRALAKYSWDQVSKLIPRYHGRHDQPTD